MPLCLPKIGLSPPILEARTVESPLGCLSSFPTIPEDIAMNYACVIPACSLTLQIQSLSELEVLTIRMAPSKETPPLLFLDPQGQLQAVRELTLHGLDDLLAEWFGDK